MAKKNNTKKENVELKNIKYNKKDKIEKIIIVVLFLLLFFAGLVGERKVGLYNDEFFEQNILRGNVLEYFELLGDGNDITSYYHHQQILAISQSVEKDHGVAPYLPIVPFMAISKVSQELFSLIWHTYTYILYFLGVVMVYLIIHHLFKNRKVALVSSLIYMASPRIFAEGLYNNKDIVLMSLVLASIYFGMLFIENKTFRSAIVFGIIGALTFNVKIIGGFIFGLIGIFYLVEYIKNCIKSKKYLTKELCVGLTAIAVMLLTFIIITPAIWGSGFDPLGYFNWCLTESTKFSRWQGTVLFEGKLISYAGGQELPLYYLPKMILITTPIYLLILFFTGVFFILWNTLRKKEKELQKPFILIFLCMLVPFLVAMLTHARLYNGWRHFYFIYGPMVLLAIYGIYNINKLLKKKKIFYTIVGCCVIFYLVACLHNGVNNTAYYNIIVNHKDLSEEYELDYYGTSAKQVMNAAEANRSQNIVYIYGRGYGYNVLENNYFVMSNVRKNHVKILYDPDEYQKLVDEGKEVYIYYNNVYNDKNLIEGREKIYSTSSWGNDMSALYK